MIDKIIPLVSCFFSPLRSYFYLFISLSFLSFTFYFIRSLVRR